jgi:hypothetical protein
MKGKCNNTNCGAFQQKVSWVQKGYGTFEMSKDRFNNKCQSCSSKISSTSIKTFGFLNAKIKIEGCMYDGNEEIPYENELIANEKGKLVYFTDYDEDIVRWGYLTVTVSKL